MQRFVATPHNDLSVRKRPLSRNPESAYIEVVQDVVRLSEDLFFFRPKLAFELRQFYCNNLSYILCYLDRTSL